MYRVVTLIAVALILAVGIGQSASNKRSYVAGHFILDLDGAQSLLGACDGGGTTSEVIEDTDPKGVARKHIGGVKYEDISVTCGTGMSKNMYEWLKASFDKSPLRRNGALLAADFDYKEKARLQFSNALITEIGMPALDASSKDAAKMTLKFSPESTRYSPGSGAELPKIDSKTQKKWLPANFRLKIDGLDEPCRRVNKIEALTIKQKVVQDPVGAVQFGYEIPNLVITLPESHAKAFYDWHEDFVIKGNNSDEAEKGGSLEYLTPDLKEALFTVTFKNLGIFKVTPDKTEAGSEQIRRVKCEMYCEDIRFNYSPAATFGITP